MSGAGSPIDDFVVSVMARRAFVFKLPDHQVDFLPGGPVLVVCFEPVTDKPSSPDFNRPVWGQAFLRRRGCTVLGFKRRYNNWYRDPQLHQALRALQAAGFFKSFRRVLFYGSSMGGYAALAFAAVAPGCTVLAMNPQSTLAPDRCWFDQRFAGAQAAMWEGDFIDGVDGARAAARVYVSYDPYHAKDRLHAQRLPVAGRINLRLPFAGHATPKLLNATGLLGPVFDKVLAGSLTEAEFREMARLRVQSADYNVRLAERGVWLPRRQRALDAALALDPSNARALRASRLLNGASAPEPRHWPPGLVIAPRVPLVYLSIPLAASQVIQRHLLTLAFGPSASRLGAADQDERLWRSRQQGDGGVVERRLAEGALTFTFVRDPGRRAYACFTKRVMAIGPRGFSAVRRTLQADWGLQMPAADEAPTIELQRHNFAAYLAFVEANLAGQTRVRRDPHWDFQTTHLERLSGVISLDHVGRVEDFASDMAWVLHRAGVRRVVDLRRRSTMQPRTPTFDAVITPALQAQLSRIYEKDYACLGYSSPSSAGRGEAPAVAFSRGHLSDSILDSNG